MSLFMTGDVDIDKKLRRFAEKRSKSLVRSAARKSLKPMVPAIKSANWPIQTGKMIDHIFNNTKIVGLSRSRSNRGKVGATVKVMQRKFKGKTELLNQGDIFYFGFLELGYVHHRAGKQEGRFELRKVADSKRSQCQELFRQYLNQGITKELKRTGWGRWGL